MSYIVHKIYGTNYDINIQIYALSVLAECFSTMQAVFHYSVLAEVQESRIAGLRPKKLLM